MSPEFNWQANWVWYPDAQRRVNFRFFARKTFKLEKVPSSAQLHISAWTEYQLFVNGTYVARGPVPCDQWHQVYDTHDVARLLIKGDNVIGIVCYNMGIGSHRQFSGPGGLICQLDIASGKKITSICTDQSWRVKLADCYDARSPRVFWSAGFTETFDFREYDASWCQAKTKNRGWIAPEVLGPHPTRPWTALEPRTIPHLTETWEFASWAAKGRFESQPIHCVSLSSVIEPGTNAIGYAQTNVFSKQDMEVIIRTSCDDACNVFVNGTLVFKQALDEEFMRTRNWRGSDEVDQVHWGVTGNVAWTGLAGVKVRLTKGWNRVCVWQLTKDLMAGDLRWRFWSRRPECFCNCRAVQ